MTLSPKIYAARDLLSAAIAEADGSAPVPLATAQPGPGIVTGAPFYRLQANHGLADDGTEDTRLRILASGAKFGSAADAERARFLCDRLAAAANRNDVIPLAGTMPLETCQVLVMGACTQGDPAEGMEINFAVGVHLDMTPAEALAVAFGTVDPTHGGASGR